MKIFLSLLFIFYIINSSFAQKKPKVALVLSGGGAKGIAHIGVIRELEKRGIKPDLIIGTSAGALVGGMYAAGLTPNQLEEIVMSADWDYLMNDAIHRENLLIGQGNKNKNSVISLPLDGLKPAMVSGVYEGQNLLTFFEIAVNKYNRVMDFDDLEIPFRSIGTNIETGEMKVFESGKLADAMRASMSIPSVFSPYEIDGELYVDGGLVNNLPSDIAKELGADIVIGVDVGAVLYKKEEINSILQILDQSASFYNARISKVNAKLCDIYIRPDIEGISALSFDDVLSIIERGVDAFNVVEYQVDSIFNKYNLSPIVSTDTVNDKYIRIQSIDYKLDSYRTIKRKSAINLMKGKMDLDNIGSIGHSVGGAVAGELAKILPEVKAGINLDGFQFGSLATNPLKKPFMFMAGIRSPSSDLHTLHSCFFHQSKAPAYLVGFLGWEHACFTNLPLLPGFVNSVPDYAAGLRIILLQREVITQFFDLYLAHSKEINLLEWSEENEEVRMEYNNK